MLAPAGATNQVRLLTYLPGTPLAKIASPARETIWEIGVRLAQLDKALATFEHPACHRDFHWDLANGLEIVSVAALLYATLWCSRKKSPPLISSCGTCSQPSGWASITMPSGSLWVARQGIAAP